MAYTIEKPADAGYDEDFFLWTQRQAELLRQAARDRINAPVDWENVAEEIESIGRHDRRETRRLVFDISVLLLMLKASSHNECRSRWQQTLQGRRYDLELILADSPSLKNHLPDVLKKEWRAAVEDAQAYFQKSHDHGALQRLASMTANEFSGEEILSSSFFPESPAS